MCLILMRQLCGGAALYYMTQTGIWCYYRYNQGQNKLIPIMVDEWGLITEEPLPGLST